MSLVGYDRIHEWQRKTHKVLLDILNVIEKKESLGYFDALIDLETDANLIILLHHRYVDLFNGNDKHDIPSKEIKQQFRGGYSQDLQERLLKALQNKDRSLGDVKQ